ncbi:segregation/condensation protein A [Candidatus Woesearchaeota archaeon]|nr:segregation/condensation protein A [Candidatus Woesearchaeota archaeon]
MLERIYSLLMKEEEITWQDIIYSLVKSEEMNPWDIDISVLTKRYIETIKMLESMDFFLSGKVLLASAILLKIKSEKLVGEDIENFDSFLFHSDDVVEDLTDFVGQQRIILDVPPLAIKTPQARKRKVSVQDLIQSLAKALEVSKRRFIRRQAELSYSVPLIPIKKINITELIRDVYSKIKSLFDKKEEVTFSKLIIPGNKESAILTFLPLLYLDTQQKIDLKQEQPFGEIYVNPLN